jgi:hypothetical protein
MLLRRVPSDPSRIIYPNGPFLWQAFLPNPTDHDGLSVNREGEKYETAASILSKAINEKVRNYGGVVAISAKVIRENGATVVPNKQLDSLGHCLIPELNITASKDKSTKQHFKEMADALARKSEVRIIPKEIPISQPTQQQEVV